MVYEGKGGADGKRCRGERGPSSAGLNVAESMAGIWLSNAAGVLVGVWTPRGAGKVTPLS